MTPGSRSQQAKEKTPVVRSFLPISIYPGLRVLYVSLFGSTLLVIPFRVVIPLTGPEGIKTLSRFSFL